MNACFLNLRRCLFTFGLAFGFCLAGALPCAAQTPHQTPSPAAKFCEAPIPAGRVGRGVGSGSGRASAEEEVKAVFTQSEVTKKAEVLFRPEPDFPTPGSDTVAWSAKLRVVLCPRGYVSNVEILSKTSDAFIEKAVEAARNIRFIPAEKDGKRVAQYATVTYSLQVY
ncbi:MAG TPA: energy transducer TonB [Pyrinomonadaceae bacterium]|nr:energy transducer TonB [Pyrinomonadaceae bacterium]